MPRQIVKKSFGNFVIYDLETTGLKSELHGVCEIAAITLNSKTLEEVGRYESIIAPYINPFTKKEIQIDPKALEVNGLTESKIRSQGLSVERVIKEFTRFINETSQSDLHKKPVLVGHNIKKFDNPMLESLFKAGKKDVIKLFNWEESIDTLHWAHYKWSGSDQIVNHKLSTIAEELEVDLIDAHRAMNDVEATVEILKKMIKSLRSEGMNISREKDTSTRFRDTFKF